MRNSFAVISGALFVWLIGSATTHAFEQTPMVPAPDASIAERVAPAPAFDGETKKPEAEKKNGGLKIPGIGKLSVPKLNFGLDLMYGASEKDDADLRFSGESGGDDDVTILGKVKRRF